MDSRERPRNIISPRGTMNLMSDKPYWWVPPVIFFIVLAVIVFILLVNFSDAFMLLAVFAGLIVILPGEFIFLSARTGRPCRYEADDEKLTVFRRNKTEEFYYSEITGVEFESFYILILGAEPFNCGYKVTIHTKLGDTVRYYAFNGAHGKNPPQETPFWILVMNMPEEPEPEKPNDIISRENYYENAQKKEP